MATLRISELDFINIKRNLKDFLSNYKDADNNVIFSDYDFEGSSLSILIDVLAYNTHYNAYLANMLANELFLDSAVKRESAVSIAKHLGYVPRSITSARASITFEVVEPTGRPQSLTLSRYHPFTTSIDETEYTFVNLDPVTVEQVNGVYIFNNVEIAEGSPFEISYRVINPGTTEKYEIPNQNIDSTTIRVIVQNSYADPTSSLYTVVTDVTELTPESNVFYVEQNPTNKYEVFFGDGVLGRKLTAGNLVRIQYLLSNGSNCNVSSSFVQEFTSSEEVAGGTIATPISTVINSNGGADAESIDSIKFNAPKYYSTYNRAVTANDYKALIRREFPLIESIATWGGDQNVPPRYGKILISLKPYDGYVVSQAVKDQIQSKILDSRGIIGITPEFVDPEYIFVGIDTRVRFDSDTTSADQAIIRRLIDTTIRRYFQDNLQQFDNDFVFSRLTRLIDAAETSIIGNVTKLHIQKRLRPAIGADNIYQYDNVIRMNNALVRGTVRSTAFNFLADNNILLSRIIDDSAGNLQVISITDNIVLNTNYGTVNYNTGLIAIPSLKFEGYSSGATDIRINAEPVNPDIQANNNQILVLDDSSQNTPIRREIGLRINVVGE